MPVISSSYPFPQAHRLHQGSPRLLCSLPLLSNLSCEQLHSLWSYIDLDSFVLTVLECRHLCQRLQRLNVWCMRTMCLFALTILENSGTLLSISDTYGQTANAKLSHGKTMAVYLSGLSQPQWHDRLISVRITW